MITLSDFHCTNKSLTNARFLIQHLILSSVSSAGIIFEPFADVLDRLFPPGHLRQDVDGRVGEVEALLGEACSDHATRGPVDWKSRGRGTFKKISL